MKPGSTALRIGTALALVVAVPLFSGVHTSAQPGRMARQLAADGGVGATDVSRRTPLSQDVLAVSVKDFGARGDGVADDHQAIRDAIDAIPDNVVRSTGGVTIVFPQGVHRLAACSSPVSDHSRSITFSYDGSHWIEISWAGDVPN